MDKCYFEVIEGEKKGKTFPFEEGMSFGRKVASVNLADKRASNLHAILKKDKENWILIDNGSSNGTKLEGERKNKFALTNGLVFQIGNTFLEVHIEAEKHPEIEEKLKDLLPEVSIADEDLPPIPEYTDENHLIELDLVDEEPNIDLSSEESIELDDELSQPALIQEQPLTWRERIQTAIASQQWVDKISEEIRPFKNLVQLNIFRGLQTETSWTIGYGPRNIGSASLDFALYEENIPDQCFILTPSAKGPLFNTNHPDKVRLNNKPIKQDVLQTGDVIVIGLTEIEVQIIP